MKMKKEKVVDMTRGSILRHLLLFSIPLIIGNVFQQLYSMVDTIIVGRTLGVDALAAVGASGSLVFFLVGFAIGLTGGFAIIVSQRFGAGERCLHVARERQRGKRSFPLSDCRQHHGAVLGGFAGNDAQMTGQGAGEHGLVHGKPPRQVLTAGKKAAPPSAARLDRRRCG